jgi:ribosomal protein S18 acetylase RimI-like enzyme
LEQTTIRPATLADIPDLVRLRRLMFESMGYDDAERLDAADEAARAYFCESIPTGAFYGWLAVTPDGEAVGSGGAVIDRHPPGPNNLSGKSGYIMNISTVPAYRRRGLARRMMQTILAWLQNQGIEKITLHASGMGKPLYEQLGFVDSNEMYYTPQTQEPGTPLGLAR